MEKDIEHHVITCNTNSCLHHQHTNCCSCSDSRRSSTGGEAASVYWATCPWCASETGLPSGKTVVNSGAALASGFVKANNSAVLLRQLDALGVASSAERGGGAATASGFVKANNPAVLLRQLDALGVTSKITPLSQEQSLAWRLSES